MNKQLMILILGVTASGKGRLAFELAREINAEIISIDSMKVYRRMDIGTAKPPLEVRKLIRHHLIDVVEPSEQFNVGLFFQKACEAIEQIRQRNMPVIAVGGTALYIKALLQGLFEGPGADETIRKELKEQIKKDGLGKLFTELEKVDSQAARRINPNDARRVIRALEVYRLTGKKISSLQKQFESSHTLHNWTIVGLRRQKEHASRRINARIKQMFSEGFIEEVKGLLVEEKPLSKQARSAIGYAEIIEHLNGRLSLQKATELIKINTRRLAKSQRTWFKKFKDVNWIDIESEENHRETLERIMKILEEKGKQVMQ